MDNTNSGWFPKKRPIFKEIISPKSTALSQLKGDCVEQNVQFPLGFMGSAKTNGFPLSPNLRRQAPHQRLRQHAAATLLKASEDGTLAAVLSKKQQAGVACMGKILWRDEILHHFETTGFHCLLVFTGGIMIPGFLRT